MAETDSPPASRYGKASIALHWLMLLLLAAVYAAMELREFYPRGSDPRETLKSLHYMLGLSVLMLVAIRIYARVTGPTPAIAPPLRPWQHHAAGATHLALYALMIGMPIAGWIILSAEGDPIPFFGLTLPPLVGESDALAHQVEELHETVGKIGYFLIGIHAAAALAHHYWRRDNVLLRMLPGRH
jgi:cytochrome b561